MKTVTRLTMRAARSRRAGAAEPVIDSVEDAVALARAVARGLDELQGADRLLMLSNLDEVRRALDARMARIEADMSEGRERLRAVNHGLRAIDGYAPPSPRR